MSKITNDCLTQSGTGCFIAVTDMATVSVRGFNPLATIVDVLPVAEPTSMRLNTSIQQKCSVSVKCSLTFIAAFTVLPMC